MPLVLECVVSAVPQATYRWFKGPNFDMELSTESDNRYNPQTESVWVFFYLQAQSTLSGNLWPHKLLVKTSGEFLYKIYALIGVMIDFLVNTVTKCFKYMILLFNTYFHSMY